MWSINGRSQAKVDAGGAGLASAAPGSRVAGLAADLSTAAGCQKLTAAAGRRHAREQRRHVRAQAVPRDPRRGLLALRDERACPASARAHYMPGMLKRNWGRIIFISRESGPADSIEMIHYGMTKTAQLAIAAAWRKRRPAPASPSTPSCPGRQVRRRRKVREGLARQKARSAQRGGGVSSRRHRPTSLLQRFADAEEVAHLVVYVAAKNPPPPTARRCAPRAELSRRLRSRAGPLLDLCRGRGSGDTG